MWGCNVSNGERAPLFFLCVCCDVALFLSLVCVRVRKKRVKLVSACALESNHLSGLGLLILAARVEGKSVTSWGFYSFLSQRCLDGQSVFIGHCLHRGCLALQYFLPCEISSM